MNNILCTNKGGLSNRIKSFVSCLRYSDEHNLNCINYWRILNNYNENVHILNCGIHNIFKEIDTVMYFESMGDKLVLLNEIHNKHNIKYQYESDRLIIFDNDNIPHNLSNFDSKCQSKKFVHQDKFKRDIDFMYNKIPKNVIELYLPYFKKIQLIDELNDKVDRFAGLYFNNNTVSVHIRSWNRNGEKGRRDFLFNIKKFEKEIVSRILENQLLGYHMINFFLTTDSQEVRDYFTNEFSHKERILVYPRTTNLDTSRDFPEGIQEDAIELFLLSKNKHLIGSHFSSYSEVAWWLGGCPDDVVIL
jgi:hypothetical protein